MYQCAIFDRKSQGGNLYATIYWSTLECRVFIVRHVVNGKSRMCSRPLRLKCISNQFKNWFSTAKCTHTHSLSCGMRQENQHTELEKEKNNKNNKLVGFEHFEFHEVWTNRIRETTCYAIHMRMHEHSIILHSCNGIKPYIGQLTIEMHQFWFGDGLCKLIICDLSSNQ